MYWPYFYEVVIIPDVVTQIICLGVSYLLNYFEVDILPAVVTEILFGPSLGFGSSSGLGNYG